MGLYGFIGDTADRQDHHRQHFGILGFVSNRNMGSIHIVDDSASGAAVQNHRFGDLVSWLIAGDILIVSELSCLGRSTAEVIDLVVFLIKKGVEIQVVNVPNGLGSERNCQSFVISLIAELKKEMADRRTKESTGRKEGKVPGRPVGSLGASKLNGKESEITQLLEDGMTKAEIARRFQISRPALHDFIVSRKLAVCPNSQ
jgi:DNA invertase Pin-like site-specific DNA recombinase